MIPRRCVDMKTKIITKYFRLGNTRNIYTVLLGVKFPLMIDRMNFDLRIKINTAILLQACK